MGRDSRCFKCFRSVSLDKMQETSVSIFGLCIQSLHRVIERSFHTLLYLYLYAADPHSDYRIKFGITSQCRQAVRSWNRTGIGVQLCEV